MKIFWRILIMQVNLTMFVVQFLQMNPEKKFIGKEISKWILKNYPDWCWNKLNRSKAKNIPSDREQAIILQLSGEISSRRAQFTRNYPKIRTTDGRPTQFYWTESAHIPENDNVARVKPSLGRKQPTANSPSALPPNEKDLYPILSKFLKSELSVYSKRIDEKRSRNKRGPGANRWRHPDLVGMENISKDWDREIKDCVQQYSDKKSKLWSFEVKMAISLSNVRESYFQAVSNSSWANYGYLVGSKSVNQETMKELRMLSSLHGIGYIQLNLNNYIDSQIVIPARERTDIDWDIANRITEENRDFLEYIRLIRQFYQTGDLREIDWD